MNKKDDNRGFSLIEVIVTIAILAVVTGASMSIYSWIKSHRLKQISENLNDAISAARTNTMTKGGSYELVIKYSSTDKAFIAEITNGSKTEKQMISSMGNIYCDVLGTTYDIKSGNEIHIAFKKVDGGFSTMNVYSAGSDIGKIEDGYIYVEYAGNSKKIKLIELTGKHYIE